MVARGSVLSFAFSSDSRQIAVGLENASINIWDVTTETLKLTLEGHTDSVTSGPFSTKTASGENNQLATGSRDGNIKIWDAATGILQRTLDGHRGTVTSLAFARSRFPNDSVRPALSSLDMTAMVWNATTGRPQYTLERTHKRGDPIPEHYGPRDALTAVVFSGDGTKLVSGFRDDACTVWDAITGEQQRTLRNAWSIILYETPIVFLNNDMEVIISGQNIGSIEVWELATGMQRVVIRATVQP